MIDESVKAHLHERHRHAREQFVKKLEGLSEYDVRRPMSRVRTLGFGWGDTGAGLVRFAEVFGGVAEIRVLKPGSRPPRARVSLFRGLWASECGQTVHMRAPLGALSCLWPLLKPACSFLPWSAVLSSCHLFMDVTGGGAMI
mgnify:CR=1 FL=1